MHTTNIQCALYQRTQISAQKKQKSDEKTFFSQFTEQKKIRENRHKLTAENIEKEDDWRKMDEKEWKKVIENLDEYIDAWKEELKERKEKQESEVNHFYKLPEIMDKRR